MRAADARFHMRRREVRQVHDVRHFVVGSLLRRDEIGVVKRRVEARRLLARGTCGLARVQGKLHVKRAGRLLVRLKIVTPDAAARRSTLQREGLAAHVETNLPSERSVVQQEKRPLLIASMPRHNGEGSLSVHSHKLTSSSVKMPRGPHERLGTSLAFSANDIQPVADVRRNPGVSGKRT